MQARVRPSGEQFELRHGEQRAVVVEVGGGLRAYEIAGRGLVNGYGEQEMCDDSTEGQSLIPWPNRLRDGRYVFDGQDHQLALTEPGRSNAIHGLVRYVNWSAAERSKSHVVMCHRLYPQPGYPFSLDLTVEYHLLPEGLTVRTTVVNIGDTHCPFGAGAHPYLTVGTRIDCALLRSPGRRWMSTDAQMIPIAEHDVAATGHDFRKPRAIGPTQLDTAYTQLQRGPDDRAWIELRHPVGDHGVALWMDRAYTYLQLFTGDSLPEEKRRQALGVEPMTCPPNAFQTGEGLIVLDPGERFVGTWGICAI